MKEEGIIRAEGRLHAGSGANNRLRKAGYLPGNVYGKGIESIPISVKKDELGKSISRFGRNAVFKLDVAGENSYTVVIRDIQNLAAKGGDLHVDFQKIKLSEEMKTDVLIKIAGRESINANKLIVQQQMDSLPLKGLPRSMPDAVEIDVSALKAGDSLTAGSIELPKGIICELEPESVILVVKESHLYEAAAETAEAADKE